jgi:colanic acid/amylovoran biosynthesis glycosyltransferase
LSSPDGGRQGPHVAYIATGYPWVSHTFIQREVLALRALGATVDTAAVRRARPEDLLSDEDRQELGTTFNIRPINPLRWARAHLRAILSPGAQWLGGLRATLALAALEPRSVVWRVLYFVQAVVLWDHVRSRGARHVHAHFANVGSDLAMLAASVGGDGWTWSFTMHGPTEFADVTAFRLAEKAQSATFVACISDYCRSQLMALLPAGEWDKLVVVHCGVDPSQFVPAEPSMSERPDLAVRLVCVARMTTVKGHAVLLDAVRLLRERGVAFELTLVGDGPDRALLEGQVERQSVADAVRFTGSLEPRAVRAALAESDILCLPSFAEGVPVVLMEAMSCAIPVVCSHIAGIPELVCDGQSGLLVRPGRPDLIADAIETLAGDPARRREMGLRGRRQIEREYDVSANAARLRDAFAAIATDG